MANYSTTATADRFIPCSEEDFKRLAAAMNLEEITVHDDHTTATGEKDPEGDEESQHGFSLELDVDGVFLYSDTDFANFDELPDEAIRIFGEILTKADIAFSEIGFSHTADRICPGSNGGSAVRIYCDGSYAYPDIVWPKGKPTKVPKAKKPAAAKS